MVRQSAWVFALSALMAVPVASMAAGSCRIEGLAEIPVTMDAGKPLVAAKINGKDVKFMIDSGAFFSTLSPASAEILKLPREMAPDGFAIQGARGISHTVIARVREFGLAGATVANMEFLVAGSSFGDAVGVLGQNVLAFADVEYDLGNGVIRLLKAQNCRDAARVYWAGPGERFSTVDITPISKFDSHVIGTAHVNGRKIRVLFDTGAPVSMLSVRAAERAGVKRDSPGVVRSGTLRGGAGSQVIPTWTGPFESFRIGSEEIRNTKLRIADIDLVDADMLLGADFFLSHRVYMAYSSNKVLFTRRGNGAIFDLAGSTRESVTAPDAAIADFGDVSDAQGYSRRSAMFAARHDLPRALADMHEAIRLSPREPEYYYQRARLHEQNSQDQQALDDLGMAIALSSNYVDARVARARVLLRRLEMTGGGSREDVISDLDAASAVASPEADVQFDLGRWYAGVDAQERAIAAFDRWLPLHRDDSRAADALAFSCRARALLRRDLSRALADCNRAVQDRPAISFPLESRGLVHLQLQNFDRAISDLDKVIAAQPANAWALYTRGLARIGAGRNREGQADIAAANAINPRAVSIAMSRGLVP